MYLKNVSNLMTIYTRKTVFRTKIRLHSTGPVRVRFAPSPTGYLHLGGLRTALYNYIFAKKNNGSFILRIEDTDQTRTIKGASEALQNDLLWSGIKIDEGPQQGGSFGPYIQSERLRIYRDHVLILLKNGSAYPCFCTDRRLQLLRREAIKAQEIPKYDNRCRHLPDREVQSQIAKGDQYCLRFKLSDQEESFDDLIYGKISYNVTLSEGDPVIIKSDGYPTYHYANVVDDHLMEISHVLRGVEWQISTTKHLLMYKAFGWNPPEYGHLPLLMNADGTKLSKRQGDIRIGSYRERHIFPLALINFIVNSGGGFDKDQERYLKPKCYTIEELCDQFDLAKINSHSGKLMPERLLEFNSLELKRQFENEETRKKLVNTIKELLKEKYPDRVTNNSLEISDEHVTKVLSWSLNRIEALPDLFSKKLEFLWIIPTSYSVQLNDISVLTNLKDHLNNLDDISKDKIGLILKQLSEDHNLKYPNLMKDLRTILSDLKEGPSVAEMIEILGKENTIKRIDLCLNKDVT